MGANAILMMRYDSAEIGNTMSEIVAYGTRGGDRTRSHDRPLACPSASVLRSF